MQGKRAHTVRKIYLVHIRVVGSMQSTLIQKLSGLPYKFQSLPVIVKLSHRDGEISQVQFMWNNLASISKSAFKEGFGTQIFSQFRETWKCDTWGVQFYTHFIVEYHRSGLSRLFHWTTLMDGNFHRLNSSSLPQYIQTPTEQRVEAGSRMTLILKPQDR